MATRDPFSADDDDRLRRLGEQYLAELCERANLIEELHPEEAELRKWLSDGRVAGKFVGYWHQRIAEAHAWRIPVETKWHVIASCLDHLFPKTANTFNPVDHRLCVQEPELFAYLAKKYSLSADQAGELSLRDLAYYLQSDLQRSNSVGKKRSTESGEARTKLIATLTKHHQYGESGRLNSEPIANNVLAREAVVSTSTASTFFNREFNHGKKGGHAKYSAKCLDERSLADALKVLRGEFTPAEISRMTLDAFEAGKRFSDDE